MFHIRVLTTLSVHASQSKREVPVQVARRRLARLRVATAEALEGRVLMAGLPTPWVNADIGGPAAAGSASYSGGTYTVTGSGDDIWNGSDKFQFVYEPMSGDGTIVAHVLTVQNTNGWAKAGVMIRETLTGPSAHAFVCATASNGVALQYRSTTSGGSTNTNGGSGAPYWVKLTRAGDTFTGYKSPDNSTWSLIGSTTITMATNVYVGLAVTAHSDGALCTATIDNVVPPTPAAPTSLSASSSSPYSVHLGWTNNSNNASGIKIERATGAGGFVQIGTAAGNAVSYDDTTVLPSTSYTYRVRATNGTNDSVYSNTSSATTLVLTIPTAPTNLRTTAVASNHVDLAWNDNSNSEQGFKIERSTDGVNYSLIYTTGVNATTYSDTPVVEGTLYYYRVEATNPLGDSAPTNIITVFTVLPAPTLFNAAGASPSTVNLTWSVNSVNDTGFAVETSADGVTFAPVATTAAHASGYVVTGLTEGTTAYYRVRAVSGVTQSAWTAGVPATPMLATPTGLGGTRAPSGPVTLNWTDVSTDESGYSVERSLDGITYVAIGSVGAGVHLYTDSAAPNNTVYYRARATAAAASSAYSNIVSFAPTIMGGGVQGAYYNYNNSNQTFGSLILTRTDATINFNWGSGSPDPSIPVDNFAVRWTGQVQAQYSETYTFYTTTDDGVRLWVNGTQIINKWQDQGGTEWSGSIALTAGQKYAITMEYFEHGGNASATLSWSSPSTAKQIIPQLNLYAPTGQNNLPNITLVAPTSGAAVLTTATTTLVADAVDADGPVSKVDFYDGSTLLGTDTAAPFTFALSGMTAGSHTFTAVATDSSGATATSAAVALTAIAAPIHVNFGPTTATYSGYVVDSGKTYQTQNGYTYGWTTALGTTQRNNGSSPDIRYDTFETMASGNNWEIALPKGYYDVHVVAGDPNNSGTKEQVYVEGVQAFNGYTSSSPTTALWYDATVNVLVADGKLTLSTASGIGSTINYVDITPADAPPALTVTSVTDGAEFTAGNSIPIVATASEPDGNVTRVDFYGDGNLIGTDAAGSDGYAVSWPAVAAGLHTISVVATDDAGRTTQQTFNIRAVPAANVPPTVSITSPTPSQVVSGTSTVPIAVSATDSAGSITKVEYFRTDAFVGWVKLGESTSSPFGFSWTNVSAGTYTIWARAWDNSYDYTDSAQVTVIVNASPSASLSSPVNNWTYSTAPANVTLTASVSDSDGTISRVTFYQDNTPIYSTTTAPYTYSVHGLATGTYNFKVSATDNNGATTTSGLSSVTVDDRTAMVTTASWLGGTGVDYVKEADIQADGTVVLAATISDATPGGVTPILLNGATASTSGAIVRLSADGKTVLSVARICTDIGDMAMDAAGNIYVAARGQGIIKLNPTATSVLWTHLNAGDGVNAQGDGYADRLDVAADGTVAVLRDAQEFAGTGGDKVVFVYDTSGNYVGTVYGKYNYIYDIAIDGTHQTVFVIGFHQATGPSHNPVQVAYLKAAAYDGTQKWMDYDWTGTQVDDPASGGTGPENNMADTRGLRVSMGRDGSLVALFNTAGGNHIFRYDPVNDATHQLTSTSTLLTIPSADYYEQFYNTQSQHKTFWAKYDPITGNIMKAADGAIIGTQLCARLPNTQGNTLWGEKSNIKVDEAGRIYFGAASASYPPSYTFNPVPDTQYGGGPIYVIYSADAKTRLFVGRFSGDGYPYTIAARTLAGHTNPNVVFGGYNDGTAHVEWTKDAIQGAYGGGTQDGYYAVVADMDLTSATAGIILDNSASSGVTITGSWQTDSSSGYWGGAGLRDSTGTGTKWVRYAPTLPSAGVYEVYARWLSGTDRASNVPMTIASAGGSSTLIVNQQVNGSKWVLLGAYNFNAGSSGTVTISNNTGNSGFVIADAVEFVPVSYPISNLAPVVSTGPSAGTNPTTGSTILSVMGNDDGGEGSLMYTWSVGLKPAGAADPTFLANGTNAAKNMTATFTQAGTYSLHVTLQDTGGLCGFGDVSVTVSQTLASITVTPTGVNLPLNGQQQYTATAIDQFGSAFLTPPSFTWSATGGTINSGLYAAPGTAGSYTVTANSGGKSGSTGVTVSNTSPALLNAGVPGTVTGTTAALWAVGRDDGGEGALAYTWSVTGKPTGAADPTFSANGTNGAKNTTATFFKAGSYSFLVTATDSGGLTATRAVNATVAQTHTAVVLTPPSSSVAAGSTRATAAAFTDQFGAAMFVNPTWNCTGGTINSMGIFTAGNSAGTYMVLALAGLASGSAAMSIVPTSYAGTSTQYTLKLTPDHQTLQIWVGPAAGQPTYTILASAMTAMTFSPTGGSSSVTIDATNQSPVSADGITFTGGTGTNTLTIIGAGADDAYGVTPTQITHGTGGRINYTSVANLDLEAGGYTTAVGLGSKQVSLSSAATLNIGAGQSLTSLAINDTSSAQLTAGGDKVLATGALTLGQDVHGAYTGKLDIANNAAIIQSGDVGSWNAGTSSYSGFTGMVASGYHGGAWNGPGIQSDFAAADASLNHGLAVMTAQQAHDNGNPGILDAGGFRAMTVSGTSTLIQYGPNGDLNMDGTVNYLDYGVIDNAFLYNQSHASAPKTGYGNGDLNLDGVINYLDYGMMDNAYLAQNAPHTGDASAAAAGSAAASVATPLFSTTPLAVKVGAKDATSILTSADPSVL